MCLISDQVYLWTTHTKELVKCGNFSCTIVAKAHVLMQNMSWVSEHQPKTNLRDRSRLRDRQSSFRPRSTSYQLQSCFLFVQCQVHSEMVLGSIPSKRFLAFFFANV